jgi:hypothetical protein
MKWAFGILLLLGCAGTRAFAVRETTVPSHTEAPIVADGSADALRVPTNDGDPSIVVTLRRGMCHGSCPSYEVTLLGDGTVIYDGHMFVGTRGRFVWNVGPAVVARLAADLQEMGYFSVKVPEDCDVKGPPLISTSLDYGGRTRGIDHVDARFCGPKDLETMERAIDRAAGVRSLVEPPSTH